MKGVELRGGFANGSKSPLNYYTGFAVSGYTPKANRVYHDENDKPKFYGRFNQGVVTINLVDVACSSGKDMDKFWQIFDERLDLCYRALMCRHKRLLDTPSDVAPILWQYGALARLKKGETINNRPPVPVLRRLRSGCGAPFMWKCVECMR